MEESISFDKDLRNEIVETTKILSKAVKSTLGPSGTNVGVLSEISLPVIVNDGVTVAKKIKFEDPLRKYISNVLKTVSQNTDNIAGDGTTTSITLTESIILEGIKNIEAGFSQIDIAKGIREASLLVLEELKNRTLDIKKDSEKLLQVATISANNDSELGSIISDAFTKVGVDGQIEVKDSDNDKTYIDILNGMKYSSGFESNMFVNTDKSEVVFENCKIFIYEGKLRSIDPIVDILREIRNQNDSLLIIADDFSPEAVNDLATNKVQHKLKVCAIKSPGYGMSKEDNLEDIAFITGTNIISNRLGSFIEESDEDSLGSADLVKVTSDSFVIVGSNIDKSEISSKITLLKDRVKSSKGTDKKELLDRIARLSNGVAVMYVSGNSPVEIAEKKYRIEDAINATRASLEEGIVPGGGVTLLKIGKSLKKPEMDNRSQEIGFDILLSALEAPLRTICENSGENGDVVINAISDHYFNFGFDAKLKEYKDLVEAGIIDPVKVTKAALTNAASVSQLILTMNCVIY